MDDKLLVNDHTRFDRVQLKGMTELVIDEVRSLLKEMRENAVLRHQHARDERGKLVCVEDPETLCDRLCVRERERRTEIATMGMSDGELASLRKCEKEQLSPNPRIREAARDREEAIFAENEKRQGKAMHDALQEFERDELPRMRAGYKIEESRYHAYALKAFDLEDQENDAHFTVRQWIPSLQEKLSVIERAGITRISGMWKNANMLDVDGAIHGCYQGIPESTRATIERQLRREQKAFDRSRQSHSMDK
jgi:hypothetical protein